MDFTHFNLRIIETNPFPQIAEANEVSFRTGKKTIGASDSADGIKKVVSKKVLGVKKKMTMRMLAGRIVHEFFEKRKNRQVIVDTINEDEGYTIKTIGENQFLELDNGNYHLFTHMKESEMYIKLRNSFEIRLHSDIKTSFYCIEIKYTNIEYKEFIKDEYLKRIFHYYVQLNLYLGFYHYTHGYLLIVNKGIFTTASKEWAWVWRKYVRIIRLDFSELVFKATLMRIIYMTKKIKREQRYNVPCPESLWECDPKYCPVRDDCDNPISKKTSDKYETCIHCGGEIRPGVPYLVRDDKIFHYKETKGRQGKVIEDCVEACRNAWREG